MTEHCPRTVALSALLDGELAPPTRDNLLAHADACPVCGTLLAELQALHAEFEALPEERLGFDLGALIEARLRAAPRLARPTAPPPRRPFWLVFPLSGAAAALTLGIYLGSHLIRPPAGDPGQVPVMLAMTVFDPVPPGNLCPDLQSCSPGSVSR